MKQAKRRLIVVLGMHRSGTSAIARSLQVLGVDLGNNLMPPVPGNNEKGFYEDVEINRLNIELLKALGSDWHALSVIPAAAFAQANLAPFKLHAIELIRAKMGGQLFGLKDPRIGKLLPFWRAVFDHLNISPSYVIAVRHPMSVMLSLQRRDGFDNEKGYYLWLEHTIPTILETTGADRVVVDFDLLMADPLAQLKRMAHVLDLPFNHDSSSVKEYTSEFLDETLRHTRFEFDDLHVDPAVPPDVINVYEVLVHLARDEIDIDAPEVVEMFGQVNSRLLSLSPALNFMTRLDRKITECGQQIASQAVELQAYRDQADEFAHQVSSLRQAVDDRDGQIADLKQAVDDRDGQIADLKQAVDDRDGQIADLKQAVDDRDGQIADLKQALSKHELDLQSLNGTLAEIKSSTLWRISEPLRWGGRQVGNVYALSMLLPHAIRRCGGGLPLLRKAVKVYRQGGVSLFKHKIARIAADVGAPVKNASVAVGEEVEVYEIPPFHTATEKKVLFVSHDASRTGGPMFLLRLIRFFSQHSNLKFEVVLCRGGELEPEFRKLAPTTVLPNGGVVTGKVLSALRASGIGLVYSNTIANGAVQKELKKLDCPVLCHVHELEYSIEQYFGGDNLKMVKETTNLFLGGSDAVARSLVMKFGIPPEKVISAHPFVSVSDNEQLVCCAEKPLNIPHEAFVVGGCGTVIWRKGPDLFIQLARLVKDRSSRPVHFIWVGGAVSGMELDNLLHDAKTAGVSDCLQFIGHVDNHLQYFAMFDAFALTSREDPFPLVALDAASLGIPVLCFADAGGTQELIGEESGCVIPYLDVSAMADALLRLIEDGEHYQNASAKIKARVLNGFDEQAGGMRIVELIDQYVTREA